MENFWTYFEVLAPSVGVGLIFWFAIRAIFRADRKERAVEAQIRQQRAEPASPAGSAGQPSVATQEPGATASPQARARSSDD